MERIGVWYEDNVETEKDWKGKTKHCLGLN
jgi:hypothetical protein